MLNIKFVRLKNTQCSPAWAGTVAGDGREEGAKHIPPESRKMTNPNQMNKKRN